MACPSSCPPSSLFFSRKSEQAARLAAALQFRTISFELPDGAPASLVGTSGLPPAPSGGCACCSGGGGDSSTPSQRDSRVVATPAALDESRAAFLGLHAHLAASFPRMHATLERHVIATYSLLYIWRPRVDAAPRSAVALAAHQDVVPVPDADAWEFPPFGGIVSNGFVHGRGAVDDKHALLAICEAVEALLECGWAPSRPVVLTFGHDEEIGGGDGAAAMAAALPVLLAGAAPASPQPLEWLLDEGLMVVDGLVPGVNARVAVVCPAEKGHVNVEVRVSAKGGHSSVPPASSAIGVLARAVTAIEAAGAAAPTFLEPAMGMFRPLLPHMPFAMRLLFGNSWLTAPLITAALLRSPQSAALLRSTTAVTMARAGLKSNVLPDTASVVVNHRVHPGERVADVVARDAAAVRDLPGVTVVPRDELEPSPVSSVDTPAYAAISTALLATFDTDPTRPVVVAPGLMVGNTDTRWWWELAGDIYRHTPTELTVANMAYFHGRDERVEIDNLARLAAFYAALLHSTCSGPTTVVASV